MRMPRTILQSLVAVALAGATATSFAATSQPAGTQTMSDLDAATLCAIQTAKAARVALTTKDPNVEEQGKMVGVYFLLQELWARRAASATVESARRLSEAVMNEPAEVFGQQLTYCVTAGNAYYVAMTPAQKKEIQAKVVATMKSLMVH